MTKAELHGKLRRIVSSEDLLTSDVFQVLQYLEPEMFIVNFLRVVFYENGLSFPIDSTQKWKCEYHFWPVGRLLTREPDVLLLLIDENDIVKYAFVIECKFSCLLSNYPVSLRNNIRFGDQLSDEFHDLLNGEYHSLGHRVSLNNDLENRFVIYLTNDYQEPEGTIKSSVEFYEQSYGKLKIGFRNHLLWTNWVKVWEILRIESLKNLQFPFNKLVLDLMELLEQKGFVAFHGISFGYKPEGEMNFWQRKWFVENLNYSPLSNMKFYTSS